MSINRQQQATTSQKLFFLLFKGVIWYGQILFQVTFIVPSKYSTYNASILDGKVTVSTRIFCQWTEQIDVPWNSYSCCLKTIICIYSVELSLLECTFNPTSYYRSMFFYIFRITLERLFELAAFPTPTKHHDVLVYTYPPNGSRTNRRTEDMRTFNRGVMLRSSCLH